MYVAECKALLSLLLKFCGQSSCFSHDEQQAFMCIQITVKTSEKILELLNDIVRQGSAVYLAFSKGGCEDYHVKFLKLESKRWTVN